MNKIFLHFIRSSIFFLLSFFITTESFSQDVTVAQDGSGNYTTVQAAINAAPAGRTAPYVIYIKNGKYKEKINVPSNKPFLQFVGESVANVILTYDDYSGKPMQGGGTFGTANSASVTIAAADFTAINITFENTTGEQPQALAINVTGDRAAFKNCRFLGGQDTIFAGQSGVRQYFRNCYIDGTVDFIFGDARAIFDSCYIYPKTRSSAGASYITAANTKQTEPWGYVFRDCKILNNRGTTTYFLGRPWQNDASTADAAKSWNKTIFLNTVMTPVVRPEGWSTWDAGTDVARITYAEYRSRYFNGVPVDISARTAWSQQLSDAQAANYYNNANLFSTWDPCAVYANFCTNNTPDIAVSNFKGVKGSSTTSFNWNISWPMNGITYEVLKSNDKITFTAVNSQTATNDTAVNFSYSEAVPAPGVTYYYLIRASKTGLATHISNDTVTISSKPTITVTGTLGSFIQGVGTPSTTQAYILSAVNLTSNLILTPPVPYEVSINGGSSWNNNSNPITLIQDVNGNVANTTVSVRLNSGSAGTYSGDIIHASAGADTVRLAVTGNVQNDPLPTSIILQSWPMAGSNNDSAALRATGIITSAPTFNRLVLSDGTTVPSVPAYSVLHGQGFAPQANGNFNSPIGPGGSVNRTVYEQFTITAASTHTVRIDSLILTTSIYNSANGRFAAVYSKSGFTIADSTDIAGAAFSSPIVLVNETAGNNTTYRLAFAGGTGITLAANETLTFRLYYAVGSTSNGRYAKLKNVMIKGLATANATLPLSFINARAYNKGNDVQVEWSTADESGIAKYFIETSVDARNFNDKGNVAAKNNSSGNTYSWLDVSPANGANFYRIRSVSFDGKKTYSGVLKVNVGKSKTEMIIAPNPVVGSFASLQLVDLPKGIYSLRIFNAGGQTVYNKSISHSGGSYTGDLQLINTIVPGIYLVELAGADNILKKTIVIQ
jgi:pectin methylesterase-like acyl-CoA thioesterase